MTDVAAPEAAVDEEVAPAAPAREAAPAMPADKEDASLDAESAVVEGNDGY